MSTTCDQIAVVQRAGQRQVRQDQTEVEDRAPTMVNSLAMRSDFTSALAGSKLSITPRQREVERIGVQSDIGKALRGARAAAG